MSISSMSSSSSVSSTASSSVSIFQHKNNEEQASVSQSKPAPKQASEKLIKVRYANRVLEIIIDYIGTDEYQETESSISALLGMRSQIEEPYVIRKGIYGATFIKNGELLFLRMELLTRANTESWGQFKAMNYRVANDRRGVLSGLVSRAGEDNYPKYENIREITGFTNEEYIAFTEKAINLKKKTENKIVGLLKANSTGSGHMYTGYDSDKCYIAYISKNRNFSIQNTGMTEDFVLKKFIDSYNDILISIGSDFSEEGSFHNRGISRNPYWVFEERYSGLSMLLHGFTGAIAYKYFPKKKFMHVLPVGSMQCIIKKTLLPGEGHIIGERGKKIDITNLEVSQDDPEGSMNYISIAALKRIYLTHQG